MKTYAFSRGESPAEYASFDDAPDGEYVPAEVARELLGFAKDYAMLFRDSDMTPEDECHVLYLKAKAIIAKAEGKSGG